MIKPSAIPQYTGDFVELAKAVDGLRTKAAGIRSSGQDAHSRFQAMAAYYVAPEDEQLFASTQPVMDTADDFAGDIESLADALDAFITEAKPHADRLKELQQSAFDFVDSVEGDDDWTEDQDKVDKHQALMDGVAAAREGFQEAERNAANKINAISPALCRPLWVVDDGTHQPGMYGQDADSLKNVDDLPWGSPEGRTYERWSLGWWGHGAKSWVWDGLAKDSIWGGIDGLGTLLGYHGEQARDEAWDGMRRTFVGGYAYGMELIGQGDELSGWQRDSKAYAKEFGKQFIAYDMWEEDPTRAHAAVSFNILTLGAGPLGAVSKLGKGGTFAKAAGTVAKVGDALDPISGGLKAAKAFRDLPKVSQVMANISDSLKFSPPKLPDSVLDLSDRYRVDRDGHLIPINSDGTPNTDPVRHEPSAADRAASSPQPDRELVGAGARRPESAVGSGDSHPPRAGHDAPGGSGGSTDASATGQHGHSGEPAAEHGGDGTESGSHSGTEHGGAEAGHGGDAADGPDTPHGSGDGSGAGGDGPAAPGGQSSDGDRQPLVRGSETEERLHAAIKGIPGKQRPKPDVLERALERLASESDGQRVAEVIASGHFSKSDGFGQVVSSLGARKEAMFQPGADQIIFAEDLVRSGVPAHTIDFEHKVPVGSDLDIRIREETGEVYGYQMKHLNDPLDPVSEITRGKYLLQLAKAEADHRVFLVDGAKGSRADWLTNGLYDSLMEIHQGKRGVKGEGITFAIRLEDGTLVIPPGSKLDPKDML
ncbi:hypothetical protein [Streptomyces sclerotialus]|uniref:hypothetical protein n=1 Tax=Streptomyces sclerotialus TaxID=1957 RepID=UPI00068B00B7